VNVGVLGAGQLGRMLALAGYPLGLRFSFFDTDAAGPVPPAAQVAPFTSGSFDDLQALDEFARGLDVVTYEFENVPVAAVRHLAQHVNVFPPPEALEASQDRVAEKVLFASLGIPTPPYAAIDGAADLTAALERIGLPAVLKTRRLGYDGKGQAVVRTLAEAEAAIDRLGGRRLIAEALVPFERELSAIATRGRDGTTAVYAICENVHTSGILRSTVAPSPGASQLAGERARTAIVAILKKLEYVGTLAVEFFDTGRDLFANEMAPRVHNTGHWTIEGARTSQFENHLRAILGLPLGSTDALGHCGMVNFIGSTPEVSRIFSTDAKLHMYGKDARPGRKLGHATVIADSVQSRDEKLAGLLGITVPTSV
jgi:5-(carboxyamino)imidazole ribonucleotide synthase